MPVAYEGYEAKAIEAVINLVAASATFTGLLSPTLPLTRIIEIDGGVENETTPTITACDGSTFTRSSAVLWAHVAPAEGPEMNRQWIAPQSIVGEGSIPVAFYFRPAGITLRHELLRYCLSKTGLIRADIENQQGQSGKWRRIVATVAGLTFMDGAGYNRGVIRSQINIQYGDLP